MAVLRCGAGADVTAQMDADLFLGIFGDAKLVLKVGNQMAASIVDNNTVRIADGVLVTQGRDIHVLPNTHDDFTIETGSQSETRYDIIGYHLYREDSKELCETFVQKNVGEAGEIEEDILRDGANEVFVSVYKVKIVGLTIAELIPLYDRTQTPMIGLQKQITGGEEAPTGGEDNDVYIQYE